MIKIAYTQKPPSIRKNENREEIFCIIRKRWFVLSPEEWVRQNFLLYLIHDLHYPASLIAVEKQLMVGELKKRFDIVVYSGNHQPYLIVECKARNVPLSEKVLHQALRYNIPVRALYIVITNGSYCMAFEKLDSQIKALENLPTMA